MNYIELHARSAFSFLEGASVPEELIAACQAQQVPAMALLDRDGVYGSPRFHLAAKKNGIKAHIGAEITVQRPTSNVQRQNEVQRPKSNVQRQKQDRTADLGPWTLDKITHLTKKKRSHYLSLSVIERVIKIFAG